MNSQIPDFNVYLKKVKHNPSMQSIFRNYINEYLSECLNGKPSNKEGEIIVYVNNKIKKMNLTAYKKEHLYNAFDAFFNGYLNRNYKLLKIVQLFQLNKIPEILSKEEIKSLFNHTLNIRHKCFFVLAYFCGGKPGQILNIKISNIHYYKRTIDILDKNDKFIRTLQISKEMRAVIVEYRNLYEPEELLFKCRGKTLFNIRSLENAIKEVAKLSGIEKNVTLQTLRHSFAIHLLEKGIDIHIVMKILGLKNKRSGDVYLNHLDKININIIDTLDDFGKL